MKVYLSSSSGVGKTTVVEALNNRGIPAFDVDDRSLDLAQLELKATGEVVDWPQGFVDWSIYTWNVREDKLMDLLAAEDPIVVAGFVGNQDKFYHLFDRLVALTIDPFEHEKRLNSRPRRAVGDDDLNIQRRIERYPIHLSKFISDGFVLIDNTQLVEQTADQIQQLIEY